MLKAIGKAGHKHSAVGSPAGSHFPIEMVVNHIHVWH